MAYTVAPGISLAVLGSYPKIGWSRVHENQEVLRKSSHLEGSKISRIICPIERISVKPRNTESACATYSISRPKELFAVGGFARVTPLAAVAWGLLLLCTLVLLLPLPLPLCFLCFLPASFPFLLLFVPATFAPFLALLRTPILL